MRTLKFIVDGQILKQDPTCDFTGLVPGTEGYIQADFSFSPEWKDCVKVAGFYSIMGQEYEPRLLTDENTCMIPAEALARRKFKIQVIGRRNSDSKLVSNKIIIKKSCPK